jgi:hypothetical protein
MTMSASARGSCSGRNIHGSCRRSSVKCRPAVGLNSRCMAASQHADSLDRGGCELACQCLQHAGSQQQHHELEATRFPRRTALAAMAAAPLAVLQHPQVCTDHIAELC